MFKHDITYENFNGETVTESFYFNLTSSEILELNASYDGGLGSFIQRIIDTTDQRSLIAEMKKLILLSYGVKSDDGKRFIKSDQLREEFVQTAAYDKLFMDLATNDNSATTFIKGIVPRDIQKEIEKAEKEGTVKTLPLPPLTTEVKEPS
jgi:hypothetical protein